MKYNKRNIKYYLYSHRSKIAKTCNYWYETDKAYFDAERPTPAILKHKPGKTSELPSPIIANPWQNWNSDDIQKITSANGLPFNFLKTTDGDVVSEKEDIALLEAYHYLIDNFDISRSFGMTTVNKWHKMIFKEIFPFAGEYRTVEMSKDGGSEEAWTWRLDFLSGLPQLDADIKQVSKTDYTSLDALCADLAQIMADFLFIHPYREGNGRMSRLLNDILLAKNGFPMIGMDMKEKEDYIRRVQAGYTQDYEPLTELICEKVNEKI